MRMSDTFNELGSIWYHSESLGFPYSPNHFIGWDFFAVSYSKLALNTHKFSCNREASKFKAQCLV